MTVHHQSYKVVLLDLCCDCVQIIATACSLQQQSEWEFTMEASFVEVSSNSYMWGKGF